ncbi:phenylacetate-CoA oxygenase subunit PaaJ [Nocardioides marmoriginsengisoli]|uniref:Phenylacetate-CoA oxygenase subunit PaaJ n=1 Tax=Nocardioides marmoriginsengisoli TaxID=661483 RepID=A0A3N0CNY1_9ACTN|nr:1,2-phenylacetyl-CoA epoxidase subunit PaaD [Nocardioides marmoriginsengisoli]RNL65060.1 phenylacetate-CoA oxygenase subunit PaaJ [Nocardioides marmoriginsengisoli]
MSAAEIRERVAAVLDPELPMVTIADLGILRAVEVDGGAATVRITPTYAGCPAMEAIADDIVAALAPMPVRVEVVLAPAWTTDWITAAGRAALDAAGIAPPGPVAQVSLELAVRCPNCGSLETRELSRFSSTACKALRVCTTCREPFDQVKPL